MGTWLKGKEYDLICLSHRNKDRDALSAWLGWLVTKVFHRYWGHKHHKKAVTPDEEWAPAVPSTSTHYRDSNIDRWVTGITSVLAPVLPTVSMSVLFFTNSPLTRLGVTVLLSFVFSGALVLVGLPRRIDAFVATATFSALLIVFVSNNSACNG